jgi:hypothetical protein
MKKLSVLFLIAILGIVLWVLPAGAEKIRLTDAELDGITAGVIVFTVPPPASIACCVSLVFTGIGTAIGPPPVAFASGSLSLGITVPTGIADGAGVGVGATGIAANPPRTAIGMLSGVAFGPKGAAVPLFFTFP